MTQRYYLKESGEFPVVQWLRICLLMQGTWVQSLVWEDPTCCGATKPVCHNYWARPLEPASRNYLAHAPQLLSLCAATTEVCAHVPQPLKPTRSRARRPQLLSPSAASTDARVPRACALQQENPPQWEARAPQWRVAPTHRNYRKPMHSNEDPAQPKINK